MNSFEDFLILPEFIGFMRNKTPENTIYWTNYLEKSPHMKNEFEKAIALYEVLSKHKKGNLPKKQIQKASVNFLDRVHHYEKTKNTNAILFFRKRLLGKVAAIMFLLFFSFTVIYFLNNRFSLKSIVYNEIMVPSGEKSTLKLSDGTIVWLNSESNFKYPADFSRENREVYLTGEGYFDVAKRKGNKFTVHTQDVQVVALGTKFNVKSYPGENSIEATLVEGSIKISQNSENKKFSDIILKPDQKLVYRKSEKQAKVENAKNTQKDYIATTEGPRKKPVISINTVNTANIVSWKDHLLVFDNESFEEIAIKLSRWYKMNIVISDNELSKHRFTGKFIHNETLIQVLEAINLTTPISYEVNEDNVSVKNIK